MSVRTLLLAAMVLVCVGRATFAQRLDADMLALEERWNQAHLKGDVATLKTLWADDMQIVVPQMEPMSKASALEFWEKVPVTFSTYESDLVSARVWTDEAIVIGRLHRVRDFAGRQSEDRWIFTKVYSRRDGEWQVVTYHASPSPSD